MLDIIEEYLGWRARSTGVSMPFVRIDGNSNLAAREEAINAYNAPGSQFFLFLLSIKAAGRGLNLQTSDTVVVFDPDPNPMNELQAREEHNDAHRSAA